MKRVVLLMLAACSTEQASFDDDQLSELESEAISTPVCPRGPSTVKGIDVSYYQQTIDWSAVANDGVKYAFIRVSDGLATVDTQFERNWAETKAKGIRRGAYQYFRPAQDVIAQADLLISKVGQMEDGDLPPVFDLETMGPSASPLSPAVVAERSRIWLDRVEEKLGVRPILYTGAYFWEDQMKAPAWGSDYLLWHAQYPIRNGMPDYDQQCTRISTTWDEWTFWQHTDSGRVAGITTGGVDMNRFNGTEEDLAALGYGGAIAAPTCGTISPRGGTIDETDKCFEKGGPAASMRVVTSAGEGGGLIWTYATASATSSNYGEWALDFTEAGRYSVEVFTSAAFAQSRQARYEVMAGAASSEVMIDQTAVDGWQTLGEFEFAAGGEQWIHLGDNTGEALTDKVQLAFDAVRVTRLDYPQEPDGEGEGEDDGGCSSFGGAGLFVGFAGLGLRRRRRRA